MVVESANPNKKVSDDTWNHAVAKSRILKYICKSNLENMNMRIAGEKYDKHNFVDFLILTSFCDRRIV